jgi:hypothetical protein
MVASEILVAAGVVIAVVALTVSVYQSWLARDHNRRSVRPALALQVRFRAGETAGLRLTNSGLGPAILTRTRLWLDGAPVGAFDKNASEIIRGDQRPRPSAHTLGSRSGRVLATDYDDYLLAVDEYDPAQEWHARFTSLLLERLVLEISYTSLYEDRIWTVRWPGEPDASPT